VSNGRALNGCMQGIAVVDNLLLVTTFPLYCINPAVCRDTVCISTASLQS